MTNTRGIEVVCDGDFSIRYPISRQLLTIEDMIQVFEAAQKEKMVVA